MKQPCDEAVLRSGECAEASGSGPWVLAAAILGSSMAFIDGTVVNVALPALQSTFHATVGDMQWVVESYGLFLSALILVGGTIGDTLGRRRIFLLGTGLFTAASIGCGFSTSISQLIIARSIQGIGAAAMVPSSLAIISAAFDEKSRGQAIGTWSGFTAITTAMGPVLGGWLIEHASWRWAFFLNVPLAVAVFAISLAHVPESRSTGARKVDWLGALLAIVSLAGLVFGFVQSASLGWGHPLVIGSLVIGAGCLILFLWVERRVSSPMMPLSLFESSNFSGANLLTLLLYSALGIFFFLFPLNLIQIHKYSATATGAASLPFILIMFVLSRWAGGLVARYGPRTPLIIGPLTAALGFALFAVPSVGGTYWTTFFPAFVVLGLGMTISVAPLTTVVMSSVEQDRAGTASGINNTVARVAGVLAIAVLGAVMVQAFGREMQTSLLHLGVPAELLNYLRSRVAQLGGLQVPSTLDPGTAQAVQAEIVHAFIFGFRVVMMICAALSVASAAVAFRMISLEAPKAVQSSAR